MGNKFAKAKKPPIEIVDEPVSLLTDVPVCAISTPAAAIFLCGDGSLTSVSWTTVQVMFTTRISTSSVSAAALSPDGTQLVVATRDATLHMVSLTDKGATVRWSQPSEHELPVTALAFVHAALLATGSRDNTVATWTLTPSGATRVDAVDIPRNVVTDLMVHPSAPNRLLQSSEDLSVHVFDVDSDAHISEVSEPISTGRHFLHRMARVSDTVVAMAQTGFNNDGSNVLIFHVTTEGFDEPFVGHEFAVKDVAMSGDVIISVSQDSTVKSWIRSSPNPLSSHSTGSPCVALAVHESRVIVGCVDGSLHWFVLVDGVLVEGEFSAGLE